MLIYFITNYYRDAVSNNYVRTDIKRGNLFEPFIIMRTLDSQVINKGANVNAKDKFGRTPLRGAARLGKTRNIDVLLKNGANVNQKDNSGENALFWAVRRIDALRMLIAAGADLESKTDSFHWSRTVLHVAATSGLTEAVELLLEEGANVNVQNKFGFTPLMNAVAFDHIETVKILLKHGADVNIKNKKGKTAFSLTAKEEIIRLLENSKSKQ